MSKQKYRKTHNMWYAAWPNDFAHLLLYLLLRTSNCSSLLQECTNSFVTEIQSASLKQWRTLKKPETFLSKFHIIGKIYIKHHKRLSHNETNVCTWKWWQCKYYTLQVVAKYDATKNTKLRLKKKLCHVASKNRTKKIIHVHKKTHGKLYKA
jgi:hypothetical protein